MIAEFAGVWIDYCVLIVLVSCLYCPSLACLGCLFDVWLLVGVLRVDVCVGGIVTVVFALIACVILALIVGLPVWIWLRFVFRFGV